MKNNWQIYRYESLTSTNDEIKKFCAEPKRRPVVQTRFQTAGRGRRGRTWQSLDGNLFFSAATEFPIKDLGVLVLISGLSVLQTVRFFAPNADIKLKWPNDVLLNDAKVSGILLEKGPQDYIIIGIGVNTAQSPHTSDMLYPVTSLHEADINVTADDFLQRFLTIFNMYLELYATGNITQIRRQWLENAKGLGQPLQVCQDNRKQTGVFHGIDENGALLLENNNGISKILVGDVFYIEKKKDE